MPGVYLIIDRLPWAIHYPFATRTQVLAMLQEAVNSSAGIVYNDDDTNEPILVNPLVTSWFLISSTPPDDGSLRILQGCELGTEFDFDDIDTADLDTL